MASEQISSILLSIFFLIVMAKIAGLLCEWFTRAMKGKVVIPAVIGEITAGIVIGNTILWDFFRIDENFNFIFALAQLGVILLLFAVGLETPYSVLRKVGKTAFFVAMLGVAIPFLAGYALFLALSYNSNEALFVGAALVATSVGITARVIKDMKMMSSIEARIIIGAAVIDDVMGLIVLSIVVGISGGSGSDLAQTAIVAVEAIIFVLAIMFIGRFIGTYREKNRNKNLAKGACEPTSAEGRTMQASALSLASYVSSYLGLAAIVGAFLAGMLFAEFQDRWFCKDKVEAINEFLVPFFFIYVGMNVQLGDFGPVFVVALVVTGVAIATKFVGCGLGAYKMGRRSAAIIGSGMFPRGEVAMIVAAIGLEAGIVDEPVYAIVVFMAIVTTLAAPPLMSYFFKKKYGKMSI
jgi:Kef-type K+ transport system membrane component KefB